MIIYDTSNQAIASVEPDSNCVWHKELMSEEYVELKFTVAAAVQFKKGFYILPPFGEGRYSIVNIDRPKFNTSNGGWDYDIKFHAAWERWKKHIIFYDRQQGNSEKSWSLTATPDRFLDIVVSNLNTLGLGLYTYTVDTAADAGLNEVKNITFDNSTIYDALNSIASTWNTEWWVEGNVLRLGRCELGTAVDLQIGVNVDTMDQSSSEGTYANRLYAFGSTRNLPQNYRGENANSVVDGVVEKRLMLPAGTACVDATPGLASDDVVEALAIFDDIYPRKVSKVTEVTTKQYTESTDNEDGTTTDNKWNAFRIRHDGFKFSKHYVLDGEELHVVFQVGSRLAGLDFAVTFNPDGLAEDKPDAQVFEIVRNDDYGISLPNDTLKPEVGDKFILYGFDTKYVGDTYVAAAEQELLDAARNKIAEMAKDDDTYTVTTDPVRCAGYTDSGDGKLSYQASNVIDLDVGQRVALVNPVYFGDTPRASRVRAFDKRLDNIYNASYQCGESAKYSNIGSLQANVEAIKAGTVSIHGQGAGMGVYVIRRYDQTRPTDANVYSAKRSDIHFLKRDTADTAQEAINFAKGLTAGTFQSGSTGAAIYKDSDGAWSAEVDNLTVRRKLQVTELDIQRLRHIGGQVLLSPAEATITEVEVKEDANGKQFILRWPARDSEGNEISNDFAVDDQIICQTFNSTTQHYWWRRVWDTGTVGGKHYISVSYIDAAEKEMDCAQGSGLPQAGDKIAVLGNRTKADRQSAIIIAGAGTGSPFIAAYKGISSYTLPSAKVYISPAGIALNVDGQVKTLDDVLQAHQADIDDIKAQSDEQVVLWFGEQVPTLDNEPASTWTTDTVKLTHVKDIYYNKAARDNGGRAYSFEHIDGNFMWVNITDKDVLSSLEKAERAQDTADGKRRVFVAQPVPPYDPGDLWVNATYPTEATQMVECPDGKTHSGDDPWARNDILRCAGSKAAGESFAIGDWRMAQEVTSAYASEIKQSASDIKLSVTELSSGLETAGIHIDGARSRISLNADTTTVDKDLVVGKLKTAESGARIEASGTLMEIYGKQARNIVFGVDDNGFATLSYYNNAGTKLYDLGPNGLNYVDMNEATMTEISVCTNADDLSGSSTEWYIFTAKRLNNVIYGDSIYTYNNQSLAQTYDGKTFKSKSCSSDNYASGIVRLVGKERVISSVKDGVEEMQSWLYENYNIDKSKIDWTLKSDGINLLYPFTLYCTRTYTDGVAGDDVWKAYQTTGGSK